MSEESVSFMKIYETAYLSADKFLLYRTIMRILYNEKEMFNAQLGTNEILEKIKAYEDFSDIKQEELKPALTQLVEWGNLVPMQDPRNVSTIEEYKNKQFRYSLSERSIKIERMTLELENLFSENNNLSASILPRINILLNKADKITDEKNLRDVYDWWSDLQADFVRINQSYSDYIHAFYSVSGEKMLRSMEFIIHKDRFVDYLRDFIRELQKYSVIIERTLLGISKEKQQALLEKILLSESELPHAYTGSFDMENEAKKLQGQWTSLYRWFVTDSSGMSVCGMAMVYTNEIIRKILSNALMLMQLHSSGSSRRQNYRQYMKMFAACEDINEAHCLSAHVFGAMNTLHYKYNSPRETDSIFENVIDLNPQLFEVTPRNRTYKPRIKTKGFSDKGMRKAAEKNAILEKLRQEQELIESFIVNNKLDISALENVTVPPALRESVLKWVTQAGHNRNKTGSTDSGRKFRMYDTGGRTVLHCTDGDLDMPSFIFEFEDMTDE